MFYVDSQRTVTRRDSSLLRSKPGSKSSRDSLQPINNLQEQKSESSSSEVRPVGIVQKELVAMLFESMLNCIVESWEPIIPQKSEYDSGKTVMSETFSMPSGGKKRKSGTKVSSKNLKKLSRSKTGVLDKSHDNGEENEAPTIWYSPPDEKAVIHFKNGNMYEGNISMKCMHGEGRFQWADGTVYLGQFINNEITGNGTLYWKDDTWYQGEFAGNMRHGEGLYVDSRKQRSYAGGWHYGTKHGYGLINYSRYKNSYDGEWTYNERFGFGAREYSETSGYIGEWEMDTREGKGIMVWPNGDCYLGEWKCNVMSGNGIYIWEKYYNNTMAAPSLKIYRGRWLKGKRNGHGIIHTGLGLGSYYTGEFLDNHKNGCGRFVTNNGFILEDKKLFFDDVGPFEYNKMLDSSSEVVSTYEPWLFDICDMDVGLLYHIQKALNTIADGTDEKIMETVNEYLMNNNPLLELEEKTEDYTDTKEEKQRAKDDLRRVHDLITFEEDALRNAIKYYEQDLRNLYIKYAQICNTEEIYFRPVLIRLYMWQFYVDCNIHKLGLTLYDIDMTFYQHREWLTKKPHDPFEKIYFWQFLQSLISTSNELYSQRQMPGPQPDTIVASGFRTFMNKVVLPCFYQENGQLRKGYGQFVPMKETYALYQRIGEPHTILTFLRGVQYPTHILDNPEPQIINMENENIPWGYNAYILGDEMEFSTDEMPEPIKVNTKGLKLFNFANLSTKKIIKIFADMFPEVVKNGITVNLEIKLTFYEFFEAFICCAEESIKEERKRIKLMESKFVYD